MKLESIGLMDNYQQVEAFRTIRTNLFFSGPENKAIVITSAKPEDGKSLVCQNLCRSIADDGKKVLLLDCDLRKSQIIKFFSDYDKVYGLSHFLACSHHLEDCIYKTDKDNFHVIPAGNFNDNATELLDSNKFKKLLTILRDNYDYVIIDTPPIGLVVDAAIISREADASILVLGSNINTKKEIKRCIDLLSKANPNIIGTVLNKYNNRKSKHYGYNAYNNIKIGR